MSRKAIPRKGDDIVDQSIARLAKLSESLPDKRTGKNVQYQMGDIVKGAFAVFFTQSPSFLARQRALKEKIGRSNAETLFQMEKIPCDEHIRQMLDNVPPEKFNGEFYAILARAEREGKLEAYQVLKGKHILISLDGTEYYRSYKKGCDNCLHRQRNNGAVENYHSGILPVIVAPGNQHVLALPPEYIRPQDGQEKQDCERAASKRWLESHADQCVRLKGILLGDDLYANEPLCQLILAHQLHFLFACKRNSHTTLYDWVDTFAQANKVDTVTVYKWNGRYREVWSYRFLNQIPLSAGDSSLEVNWLELHITHQETGKTLYYGAWVTDLPVTSKNVTDLVDCARARWKVENESNNVLKTKGYHLEHNFGHGDCYLAMTLVSLNLLAFLLHTVSHLTNRLYQQIRDKVGRRDTFFHDVQALTRYLVFECWEHLLVFMGIQLEILPAPD